MTAQPTSFAADIDQFAQMGQHALANAIAEIARLAEALRRSEANWHSAESEMIAARADAERLVVILQSISEIAIDAQGEWAVVSEAFAPADIMPLKNIESAVSAALAAGRAASGSSANAQKAVTVCEYCGTPTDAPNYAYHQCWPRKAVTP